MKRLSLLLALSALSVVSITTAANAQYLSGNVLLQDTGAREIPLGTSEVGRFARFTNDERMMDRAEVQLKNRDYEDWKPLDVRSKEKMEHFMFGSLKVHHPLVPEQETGMFARFSQNWNMAENNMWWENRDFQDMYVNGATGKKSMAHYIHGLSAGSNLIPPSYGYAPVRVGAAQPLMWY